jgi:anti-sigma regulatory factor (Ser/Thr protein kinase)
MAAPSQRVWNLIGRYGPDVAALCQAGDRLVPGITGIGLSAGRPPLGPRVRFTSDDTSAAIEDAQLSLEEGPCRDVAATRQPVVAADLTTESWRTRWPRFTPAALGVGVRAVFALPLHAGGVRHEGAVDMYRRSPGGLDGDERTAAKVFAAAVAELLTLEELKLDLAGAFTHRRPGATDSPTVLLVSWFDAATQTAVRDQVRSACADRGLSGEDLFLFVLAVHEAMANAARHGGGHGQLLLWWQDDHLWCEVSDHGPGLPGSSLPVRPPDTRQVGERGLWLIRRACTSCKMTTDPTGTRLLLGHRVVGYERPRNVV